MKYVIGNLKMNLLTPVERDRYIESFLRDIEKSEYLNTKIVLCPPYIHLEKFANDFNGKSVSVGAQNVFFEDRGSFTGEISPLMLKGIGVENVILGHSERRALGENDEFIKAKLDAAVANNLNVILCVGETKEEREQGKTGEVIAAQINSAFNGLPLTKVGSVIIAYEPIWAVGTDLIPSSDEILGAKILIKKILAGLFGVTSEKVAILYGGSVKAKTVKEVCIDPEMDGVLVGRESLIPFEFLQIVKQIDSN